MKKILILLVVIVVAGIVWWLVSPLFVSNTVDEDFPTLEELEEMSEEEKELIREPMMEHAAAQPPTVVEEEIGNILPGGGPARLLSGMFRGADSFHQGSGIASVYRLADSSLIVRFEDFSVTNGPDLRVLLAENTQPTSNETLGEHIELGKLKGNQGNQNYTIPAGTDLSLYKSVVIYCKPFSVVFSTATLE